MPHRPVALVNLLALLVAAACGGARALGADPTAARLPPTRPSTVLTVFAAASLTGAFAEIGEGFEAGHPGVRVIFNFGGSQSLRYQLEQGAVADVFASASQRDMTAAVAAGLVAEGVPRVFLTNQLTVIMPPDNPGGIHALEDLGRPGLKLVLAAEEVPAGAYSREVLAKLDARFGAGYRSRVLTNVVSNEDNVKQVVAKVQLGEADAGMVYSSDAVAAPDLKTIAIPAEYNVLAEYPIAPLLGAPHPDLAAAFARYVLGPEGQAALQRWGFTPALP